MSPGRPFVGLVQFVQHIRLVIAMLGPAKRLMTCLFVPILFSPMPILFKTKEASCAYVVLIMAYFWLTEALPLAVTALIPVFAFPLLSVDTASAVSSVYLSDSNFVFFGSMVLAVAVESSRLHERIALNVLLLTGPNPRWLMLGFQLATAFLSMWISNTATTMMMVPIVVAVIKELDLCHRRESDPLAEPLSDEGGNAVEILDLDTVSARQLNIYKGLLLSICFAASIGGTGTLIGTGSNIVLNAYLQKAYAGQSPVTFASFMIYAVPQALILLLICWLWLQLLFVRVHQSSHSNSCPEAHNGIGQLLAKKHKALGQLRYEEKTILVTFAVLIFLWLTRQPMVVPGWGNLFPKGYVSDGTTAMAVSLALFVLPAENPFDRDVLADLLVRPGAQLRTVMTWRQMSDKFSWSTLLLLGGGYAMADGVESSGLADWIGARLASLEAFPDWVFIACACLLVTFLTEFSSNVATASIFIPMVASIARANRTNPLVYILPVCFSSSFAFMFPSGTPPNAIVFAVKILRVGDMMLGGLALNIAAFFLSQVLNHTYAHLVFDLQTSPFTNDTVTNITNDHI